VQGKVLSKGGKPSPYPAIPKMFLAISPFQNRQIMKLHEKMKAIICTKYGPPEVLQIREVNKPIPKDNEILIKTHAANVTVSDCIVRSGRVSIFQWLPMRIFVGVNRPRNPILGFELAGEVEAIGRDIKRFKQGDPIFGFTGTKFGAQVC
jgi:NADPH:quinone reductase-like Zn-dependent oxidoreductase